LITVITFGEEYKVIVQMFPQLPTISYAVGPDIHLSALVSDSLSLCSSRDVKDQVSHPYKSKGKITVVCVLTFMFVDSRREDKRF
jgi:hypothetical protein